MLVAELYAAPFSTWILKTVGWPLANSVEETWFDAPNPITGVSCTTVKVTAAAVEGL